MKAGSPRIVCMGYDALEEMPATLASWVEERLDAPHEENREIGALVLDAEDAVLERWDDWPGRAAVMEAVEGWEGQGHDTRVFELRLDGNEPKLFELSSDLERPVWTG